jgi:hypothetical protein
MVKVVVMVGDGWWWLMMVDIGDGSCGKLNCCETKKRRFERKKGRCFAAKIEFGERKKAIE